MAERFKAPRGTFDVLPEQQPVRRRIDESSARRALEAAGYGRIETPVFEDTDLFARGVGESTDIVQKQMFTFEDQGGRSLTLRPEATASICRAYLEHGMQKLRAAGEALDRRAVLPPRAPAGGPLPAVHADRRRGDRLRLAAGRRRADRAGGRHPRRARRRGRPAAARQPRHAGDARAPTSTSCATTCAPTRASSPRRSASRIDANPLRAFDADHEGTRKVMADAPTLLDRLDPADAEHFERVREHCSTATASPTSSTRPWSAVSTTTRAPSSSSSASGSARSPGSAAGAATTA